MSLLQDLRIRASAELDALKADTRAVEVRIEEAFHTGAMHAAFATIEADALKLKQKVKAEFDLLKQQAK
jgi:hypothetical protein